MTASRWHSQVGASYPPAHFMSMVSTQAATVSRLLETCYRCAAVGVALVGVGSALGRRWAAVFSISVTATLPNARVLSAENHR